MQENNLFIRVFKTNNRALFITAKSLLDNAGIKYSEQGESLKYAYGGPMIIEVLRENEEEATEILKELINGSPEVPETEYEKKLYDQKNEFNYAIAVGAVLIVIVLILIAVVFVRC
jgi:hypothetical protein